MLLERKNISFVLAVSEILNEPKIFPIMIAHMGEMDDKVDAVTCNIITYGVLYPGVTGIRS